MAQADEGDGDELLRFLILAALAKADRPLDAEELAERGCDDGRAART